MILPDVNVLLYASRGDAEGHDKYYSWLTEEIALPQPFGLSDLVLSAFLRIVTHPRVFSPPTPLGEAIAFAETLRSHPNVVLLYPGPRHWGIFTDLCRSARARGNLIPDAYLAALAIEHGAELLTTDRDFSRFSGLRWRHPLE